MTGSSGKRIAVLGWISSVHVQRWARGLTSRGYKVKVFSLGGKSQDGIASTIFPRSGRISYFTKAGQAAREVAAFKPHLVHAHYAAGFGWWMLKCSGCPRVVSVWGADIMDFPNNLPKRWMIRKILSEADHITATSRLLKNVTEKLLPQASEKTSIIPFGVTVPDEIVPMPETLPVGLCYVKAHRKKYGPDILLKALAIAKKTIPELKLTIAGEGELTEQLKMQTARLELTQNVDFVGFIDNDRVYDLIRDNRFMVMPSVMDSESFGVAVLEAGACGRAVIASRVGGVPEVLPDGRTGLLVPPRDVNSLADAIVTLARDKELCRKMGEAGYKWVAETYDWKQSLDAMVALYDRLIGL